MVTLCTMKHESIDTPLSRAPLPVWQRAFASLETLQEAAPWKILQNYHFIGFEADGEMLWLQVLGSGGESRGFNLHRGTRGLAALLRILAGGSESDAEAQVLMRGLDCLSLSLEPKKQLDGVDSALLDAAGLLRTNRKYFPQIRDCQPGWYPWFPDAGQLEQASRVMAVLTTCLPMIAGQPELLEPADDDLAGVIFRGAAGEWLAELRPMPDFDSLDQVQPAAPRIKSKTLAMVQDLVARLPKLGSSLELGCIVLANASDPLDGGRPFFPHVLACVEAKAHALLSHKVVSPAELTVEAWLDCLLEGIAALGQIPGRIDTDDLMAAAAVQSIADLLACEHRPEQSLKALETVERAMDRLL